MTSFDDKKYFIITYGCQMNVHDSEKIAGMFESLGMSLAADKESADYILFNTCCIRESAEDKAYNNICAIKPLKSKKPNLRIIVCGCMPQQQEGKYNLKNKFDFVDIIIGTHNVNMLKRYILTNSIEHSQIYDIIGAPLSDIENTHNIKDDTLTGYVNISYGCDNFCTYCIVPYVRGRERSRPMKDIINDVRLLIDDGYKYITLLGQNVNSYGKNLKSKDATFPNLLRKICKLEGNFKIKFLTSHPKDFSDDLIDVIAENTKLARVIHLPIQSGNDRILAAMNRKYTVKQYLAIIKKLRKKIKNVAISTDIIVGFPGETDVQFNDTLKLLKKVTFSAVFAFIYSKRTGTPAAKMSGQIDKQTKNERVNKVLDLQKTLAPKVNKYFNKKLFRALVRPSKNGTARIETDFGRSYELLDKVDFTDPTFKLIVLNNLQATLVPEKDKQKNE